MEWLFVVLGILLFLLIIVVLNIKIVPQSKAYVIERLGTYHATWETGLRKDSVFGARCKGRLPEGTGGGFPAAACYHKG